MASSSGILSYLADCYRENGSRFGVANLASGRVRRSLILSGEDAVVSGSVLDGLLFVPGAKAAELASQARLYQKESELLYGSVFVSGSVETEEGRPRPLFAPLLLYRVSVERVDESGGGAEFSIDTGRRLLNDALLACLGDESLAARLEACVETAAHTEGCVGEIRRLFAEAFPEAETERLLGYPHLLGEAELERAGLARRSGTEAGGPMTLAPVAALLLADRSAEMRGVLDDLAGMAARGEALSDPVRELLGVARRAAGASGRKGRGHVPAFLSEAQSRIADSARTRPLTLAVGPPGTGKSFTIAALAMEAVSRGETVLIASKMDHAVDVVADKIEEALSLPGLCVRGGRKSYLKDLRDFLEELLSGLHTGGDAAAETFDGTGAGLLRRQKERLRRIGSMERRTRRLRHWSEQVQQENPGFLRRWWIDRIRRAVERGPALASDASRLDDTGVRLVEETRAWFRQMRRHRLAEALRRDRQTFMAFSKGLRARSARHQEAHFDRVCWRQLLGALPVWLVNLSDLHRVLPLEDALFDLVIIDEASQCDIASALPALERAKRAVVTGDPKQLRHVSFLSRARQAEFAAHRGLDEAERERFDFRGTSLVDLATATLADQSAVVFLDEHFRSRPEIIGFSNREFYRGGLVVMTGLREADRVDEAPLVLRRCRGERGANGVNPAEVDLVLAQLDEVAARAGAPLSVGILSPFRDQVDAIQKRIEAREDLARLLDRHGLLVGTAHSFQGEERDVMILSLALDDRSPAASFRFLGQEDVFNVSITRARVQNRVICSFDPGRAGAGLVARYLSEVAAHDTAGGTGRVGSPPEPSWGELIGALEGRGFEVAAKVPLGGTRIDLVVRKGGRSVGIDLIGFPGDEDGEGEPPGRRRTRLRRAGVALFPLPYVEWRYRQAAVLEDLERWVASR